MEKKRLMLPFNFTADRKFILNIYYYEEYMYEWVKDPADKHFSKTNREKIL